MENYKVLEKLNINEGTVEIIFVPRVVGNPVQINGKFVDPVNDYYFAFVKFNNKSISYCLYIEIKDKLEDLSMLKSYIKSISIAEEFIKKSLNSLNNCKCTKRRIIEAVLLPFSNEFITQNIQEMRNRIRGCYGGSVLQCSICMKCHDV